MTGWLCSSTENGLIKLVPVSTQKQLTDIMTKVLGRELFVHFRDIITSDMDLSGIDKRTCAHYATVFKSRNKMHRHLPHCTAQRLKAQSCNVTSQQTHHWE